MGLKLGFRVCDSGGVGCLLMDWVALKPERCVCEGDGVVGEDEGVGVLMNDSVGLKPEQCVCVCQGDGVDRL